MVTFHLLITFTNSLDPDQVQTKLCSKRFDTLIVFLKYFLFNFEGRLQRTKKSMQNCPACKELDIWPIVQLLASLTADVGVVSLVPAWSHTLEQFDHEITIESVCAKNC